MRVTAGGRGCASIHAGLSPTLAQAWILSAERRREPRRIVRAARPPRRRRRRRAARLGVPMSERQNRTRKDEREPELDVSPALHRRHGANEIVRFSPARLDSFGLYIE